MASLFGSLSIALSSMNTQQSAIAVTANNVSNINTPGYSRQRANLAESDALQVGNRVLGTGVNLQNIVSLRDRVLELRIDSEKQQQGTLQAQISGLSDLEPIFSLDTGNLGDSLNTFFNDLSNLSSDPSSIPLRQSALLSAQNLADKFRTTAAQLHDRQASVDLDIQQSVQNINVITTQLAKLNGKIKGQNLPEDQIGALVDQRNNLLQDLSNLVGNSVTQSSDGLTITTAGGIPLVVGDRSFDLVQSKAADGTIHISNDGQDITQQISGGSLAGELTVRGTSIPNLLSQLDSLATTLATNFNAAHKQGFDLNGNAGTDFFAAPPAGGVGAAAAFTVNITDPKLLAASTDGTTGSNGNLTQLVAVRDQTDAAGKTLTDRYASIAFDLGSQIANAQAELGSSEVIGQQLDNQRGAISGVSLDEEAADLVRFQRAYEAAARVLTIISDLTETAVNLGRS